jgi:hypothetical protein
MKKISLFLLLILGVCGISTAQVCKISDTGDNVEVFSASIDGHMVSVVVGNDSQDKSANVTVSVTVKYKNSYNTKEYTFTSKAIAKPNQTTEIKIDIPERDEQGRVPVSVNVTGITGTKCL